MPFLPAELIRRILRYATIVEGAFDTSYASVQHEDRDAMSRSIADSLTTKLTLSLVSKLFHTMMDEFLFEIICVKNYRRMRPLAVFLRQQLPSKPTRGWWCRRLELDLEYDDSSWNWGSFTLWGLLPACPRLTDFRCHIEHVDNRQTHFPLSDVMLKSIASSFATTLRRLELTGQVTALFEDVEHMLIYLPRLESCVILGLQVDQVLSADPTIRESLHLYRPNVGSLPSWYSQDKTETNEYLEAWSHALWPSPHNLASSVTVPLLPHLHTLHISHFKTAISGWQMPSLITVGAGFRFWSGAAVERAEELMEGIHDYSERIRSMTFYGQRGEGIDIWHVVLSLPNLESFEYQATWRELASSPTVPLQMLHTIALYSTSYVYGFNLLQKLYKYREDGLLPALKRICTTMGVPAEGRAAGLSEYFAAVGISLDSNVIKPVWVLDLA